MLPRRLRPKAPKERGPLRSPGHLAFVRTFACVVPGCLKTDIEACHLRLGTDGSMGRKPSDNFAFSGCHDHHAESHRIGEASFQKKYGLDLLSLTAEFAKASPILRNRRRAA